MRLICLNLWGAKQGQILFDYLKSESLKTDIFCFQEVFDAEEEVKELKSRGVRTHLFKELVGLLEGFTGYFAETSKNHDIIGPIDLDVSFGLAFFVKKEHLTVAHKTYEIFGNKEDTVKQDLKGIPRGLQHLEIRVADTVLNIFNYHGVPYPGNKLDSPERIKQSKKILEISKAAEGSKILCGDFNLMPGTESIKFFERDYKNLIKEFGVKSTRNKISWTVHNNVQYFADFIFISPKIKVKSFDVPYMEISDHLPLNLNFDPND